MAFYSRNDRLLCKVFPSSLSPIAMRWFNSLKKGSIHSFFKLIQAFRAKVVTCSQELQLINALLSMATGSGETFQSYSDRYWELYNEIGGDNEHVAASTFKLRLPLHFELRDSLTMQPPENMHYLMRRIEEHKRLEDDKLQNKAKAPAVFQYQKESQIRGFQQMSRRETRGQNPIRKAKGVNIIFKEPVHKI